jgi:hypothetical protein
MPLQAKADTAIVAVSLMAAHSQKCLDVAFESQANSAPIIQFTCNGKQNQQWWLVDKGNSEYQLKAVHSGKCLDVPLQPGDGVQLVQYDCHEGSNQRWRLV